MERQPANGWNQNILVRHSHIPETGNTSNLFFEFFVFMNCCFFLSLQYINMYKTVWWLPQSNASYAVNFYLIDGYLVGLVIVLLSRRFVYYTYREVLSNQNVCNMCIYYLVKLIKIFIVLIISASFIYFSMYVFSNHNLTYSLFLFYPFVTYFLLFQFKWIPLFGKICFKPQHDGCNHIRSKDGTGSQCYHILEVAEAGPNHVCSISPESIREETEVLKSDFNIRITQILFNSMFCTYYSACIPICYAQNIQSNFDPTWNSLYYDVWWVTQYIILIWLGSLILFATHYFPIKYLDNLHRCALHLGKWIKIEITRVAHHTSHNAWSELQIWPQDSTVKHVKGLFKAEGKSNAAEPGNAMHTRFYFMFCQPLRVTNTMLILCLFVIGYEFILLIQSNQWNHLLSLSFLLFSNYYSLFTLMRNHFILDKAYKSEMSKCDND